ncbi:hypothetical protein [Marinicrinis lubricantis]|uniref:Rhamnogalacturonan I lyase beta-sheet domain-containing protein n=1 Tax=Marinicrinis lubricantis TaxID=2086470 RepID=A0ABW1IT38_9BACL
MKRIVCLFMMLSFIVGMVSTTIAANEQVGQVIVEAETAAATAGGDDIAAAPNQRTMMRSMENLGRGVVAVREGSHVFISWRLLALDPSSIGFNVYRSTDGGDAVKLNDSVLTQGTNYTDTTADLTKDNAYFVRPVMGGIEQNASSPFTLPANQEDVPYFTVPLRAGGSINHVWVGDFDGDGEYDFLVVRETMQPQIVEAYKRDGTLLWEVSLGPNSLNQDNISPGSATINVGHWDGITAYDMDGDGKSEVILKIANGVTFGDGTVWSDASDTKQWLAVLDGMTGELRSASPIPDDYIAIGPLAAHVGIGYLNGTTPSVVLSAKNRNPDKSFNMLIAAYHLEGEQLVMDWKWLRDSEGLAPDGHNIRLADVDGDGKDEIAHIGFVLDDDGTMLYSLTGSNVVHGDRFYIGKMDPNRPGLQGYGIQQDNPYGLLEYYYDAGTGQMIWQHSVAPPAWDVGRGDVGDLDPGYPGYEVFSFEGIYNGPTNTEITAADHEGNPWPTIRLMWDGDLLSESYNNGKIEKWQYETQSLTRLETPRNYAVGSWRGVPKFLGDIVGDWREEVILTSDDHDELIIFTTPIPTDYRIYTLAQNPLYRNSMTVRGYMQSHLTDYYLGHGMSTPPTPNIYYAGQVTAGVKVDPGTLNLKSQGNEITAYIELPSNVVSPVDADSIGLHVNGTSIAAVRSAVEKSDRDKDGSEELMVKFDRQQIIGAIAGLRDAVIEVRLTGHLQDGRTFSGKDTVHVIH